ncbi:MAG: transglutaminase family protein [Gammaproteobacteria bacterium]|nr:transglutaminase family protein [Gammaproteobacteria bacterium]
MDKYIESSQYIDWQTADVETLANRLSAGSENELETAKRCFEWVRDEIKHSADYKLDPVTCKASDVLREGTGYCYAKSHLLAALLRANGIPAGLCYQRLSVFEKGAPYCLHGLNAVYLQKQGWYRMDARGNKHGVDAQFNPPYEKLAFQIVDENEADLPEIFSEPLPNVVAVLEKYLTFSEVLANLPDVDAHLLIGRRKH